MPRGNDALAAGREALADYGDHLHAEDLIRAHAATINPALQKILNSPYDEEETAAVQEDLTKVEHLFSDGTSSGDLEEGEQILSAAVHGNAVVAVIETIHGDTRKAYAPYNEKFAEPKLSPMEQARWQSAQEEGRVASETAKIRDDAQRRLREERDRIERDTEEQLAEIRRQNDERLRDAEATLEKAREEVGDEPIDEPEPVAEAETTTSTTKKTGTASRKTGTAKKTAARKKTAAAKKS